jgi:hypothetical protein
MIDIYWRTIQDSNYIKWSIHENLKLDVGFSKAMF